MRDDAVSYWMESAQREPLLTPAEELHLGGLVRAWQDHPRGPDQAPPAVIRRGRRARDRMVAANLRLVASYAQNRRHDGPLEDRFQNGALGLCTAAEKFDPARGYKFSTYAFWWLRANIGKGEVAENAIRLPPNVHAAVRGKFNGECSTASLDAGRAAAFVMSLDYILPGEGVTTLGDLIAAPGVDPDVADLYDRIDALDAIQQRLVFGRWGDPPQSYAQLASQEAISAGEVRKMLAQAMEKLRGAAPPPPPAPPPMPPPLGPCRPAECCQLNLGLLILNP